jgi:hypothetical protein
MRRISWLCLAATSVAAVLLVTAPAVAVHPAQSSVVQRCGDRFVPAVIGGRRTCLQRGMACRSRFNSAYHRYVFHCDAGYLVYWWTGLLRRQLHLPAIAASAPCPATDQNGTLGDHGNRDAPAAPAFGPGPAFPTLQSEGGRAELHYTAWGGFEGWGGSKVLWTVPRYSGPYIVRGRQLNGSNRLKFDWGPSWTNQLHDTLRLTGALSVLNPAATFLQAPGCYAYQVDGRGFSYLIVFEARSAG